MSDPLFEVDVAVIGSGFGGSTSALRLTEKGYSVAVFEAGNRFEQEDYPKTNWDLRRFLFVPKLGLRGIQRMTLLKDVLVLSGAGVGGGSLVYANTLYEPLEGFWSDPQWANITDWRDELAPHFAQARLMLGATQAPDDTAADGLMRGIADRLGVAETYRSTDVAVYVGTAGEKVDDPYFGGAGPDRTGCIQCGGCMIGCRHNAKNTLDRNYLYLAEANGAKVHPGRQVVDVVPLPTGGYEITSERSGAWLRKDRKKIQAEQVIFAAGVLGSMRLLADLQENGRLPHLSRRLGRRVRTNSEAILGAQAKNANIDYSKGLAITSSIYPDDRTHIEPVRYPEGSNAMGMLSTILVDGGGRVPRQVRFIGQAVRHPIPFIRSLSVRRWSERTVILLVMQSADNSLNLKWKRRRNGSLKLTTEQGEGDPNPTYIPIANEAARIAAGIMGGQAGSAINEVLLDVPTTAHILGGACIGDSAESGVVDGYQRVFGHPGLSIADASTISANLGVNPSLTITAQTERALSFWPNKGETDPRPPLGEEYVRVDPVAPRSPAVPPHAPAALVWT
ncbi:MAG: GMC family oxidoreductase [Acidimicrobiales bacterium]|nr:GMC family oxidoreductase [Acidimicrobiales bacterium]